MVHDDELDVIRITEWELVEFSIVSVPSNREALVISRDMKELTELRKDIVLLKDMVAELRQPAVNSKQDARQSEEVDAIAEPPAIEIDAEAPQEATAEIPLEESTDSDSATHDDQVADQGEPEPQQPAPRMATADDYAAIVKKMVPEIRKQVRRSLGKE